MFSRTVERVLNAAAREAVSRRPAHLTLEHLLFAIINETSGDKILRAAGANTEKIKADLDAFLDENLETLPLGAKRLRDQTLGLRRVLPTAAVQSATHTSPWPSAASCRPPSCTCRARARRKRTWGTSWPRCWPRGA